jgi:hypothetical protein
MKHLVLFENFDIYLNEEDAKSPDKYKCVPEDLRVFASYAMDNAERYTKLLSVDLATYKLLVKSSLGIIGRETKFGKTEEFSDQASEFLRSKMNMGDFINWGLETVNKIGTKYGEITGKKFSNKTQSLGLGQFTPETWKQYKLDKTIGDFDDSFDTTKQGLAVLYTLALRYKKALASGLKKEPSVNPVLKKYLGVEIKGTGNNALDLAIVGHNMGEGVLTKWCETSHPLYASPIKKKEHRPYAKESSFDPEKSAVLKAVKDPKLKKFPGTLKVYQDKVIPNFFPNLKGPEHTAIGYVEEVAKYMKNFNCI